MRSAVISICLLFSSYSYAKMSIDSKQNNSIIISVDKEIRPHFMEFLQYCELTRYADRCKKNLTKLISVKLKRVIDQSNPDTIGFCIIYDNFREIRLKRNMFPYESLEFKLLVWHELGHCLMDLPHTEERLHLMNPAMMEKKVMLNQWVEIVRDFLYGPPISSK